MAASRLQDLVRLFFLAGFFRVLLHELSERGVTRSLFTVKSLILSDLQRSTENVLVVELQKHKISHRKKHFWTKNW